MTGVLLEGVLVFWSLKYTTAARSSLFANTSPIFTILLAMLVLKERLDWRKTLGMSIGFLGVAMAISSRGGDIYFSVDSVIGDLLALGSGICWAAYTVWGAGVAERHGSLIGTAAAIMIGTTMIFAVILCGGGTMSWRLSWKLWLAMAYLGVCGNGIAYLCWYAAMKHISASEVGAFGYISAALAAALSFIFLRENFSFGFALALAAVVLGVYLMVEKSKSPK